MLPGVRICNDHMGLYPGFLLKSEPGVHISKHHVGVYPGPLVKVSNRHVPG